MTDKILFTAPADGDWQSFAGRIHAAYTAARNRIEQLEDALARASDEALRLNDDRSQDASISLKSRAYTRFGEIAETGGTTAISGEIDQREPTTSEWVDGLLGGLATNRQTSHGD